MSQDAPAENRRMMNFFINGKPVSAPEGTVILAATIENGFIVPYFCYHPELKPAGLCRMCLVEIEGMPKLQASCTTPVAEGMKIRTDSDRVVEARKAVLEFYLVNHPLDCPICDKAGECWLQDNAFAHARQNTRVVGIEKRRYKPVDIGTKLTLDMDRCVHCLRCVRFSEEIVGDDDLSVFGRGDRTAIGVFQNPVVNDYAINIAELCPVGALVSKDFLFKARVWHLKKTETICTSCATGCNINMETKDEIVERITPRKNMQVNGHWICDYGRLNFRYISGDGRILDAVRNEGGTSSVQETETILAEVAEQLRTTDPARVAFLLTPEASNEEVFEFRRLAEKVVATENVAYGIVPPEEGRKDFLRSRDAYPNSAGVRRVSELGKFGFDGLKIIEKIEQGRIDVLFMVYPHSIAKSPDGEKFLRRLTDALSFVKTSIVMDYLKSPVSTAARYVIPGLTHAEKAGTMDNAGGLTQKIRRAVRPSAGCIPEMEMFLMMSELIVEKRSSSGVTVTTK